MVNIRLRIGRSVREFRWAAPKDVTLNDTEDKVTEIIRTEYNVMSFTLEYLGRITWDVLVDGNKVGHVHAWDDRFPDTAPLFNGPTGSVTRTH